MTDLNRIHNASNPHQGSYKKVLAVCSAGLLRSPTVAYVLSQDPYNFNTRAAGIRHEYALIAMDTVLLSWCDEIVVVEPWMAEWVQQELDKKVLGGKYKKIVSLNIPDEYSYRHPDLIDMIKSQYASIVPESTSRTLAEVIEE